MSSRNQITIVGARAHNLKNVSLDIPRDQLVVITGVSGSGKSSLAFDTIFAEGSRRYIESLSAYARQFIGQMDKPDVDRIDGLSPAISIDQRKAAKNPRSTVGTVTEIYDYLRLLFARIGHPHCPICGREIIAQTPDQLADHILASYADTSAQILAPLVQTRKGEFRDLFAKVAKDGYSRVKVDGEIYDIQEVPPLDKKFKHSIDIIIDRFILRVEDRHRLVEALEQAQHETGSLVRLVIPDKPLDTVFSTDLSCPVHATSIEPPAPRNFSFNSPHGACPVCTGLGQTPEVDGLSLVTDPSLSLNQGVLTNSLTGGWGAWIKSDITRMARANGISTNKPWRDLSTSDQQKLLYDSPRGRSYYQGIVPTLNDRYRSTESETVKADIEQHMMRTPCSACQGKRLKPESLAVTVGDKNIADITKFTLDLALDFINSLSLTPSEETIAAVIRKEIGERLNFLLAVGLHYLTLDRTSASLSGGEAQRIRLATQIGSRLRGVLYVLDEPSIGLHQRDNHKLIATLKELRDLGNTVLVVEHDEDTMRAADYIIDVGPGAGEHGGHIVAAGTVADIKDSKDSLTGAFLRGDRAIEVPLVRRKGNGNLLTIKGARANNLKNLTVNFPLGTFICVTGVSGSGKSSLIDDILSRAVLRSLYRAHQAPGPHDQITGLENIDQAIVIDQSPIGRTPRSNPATYVGLFTPIRELFALLPESKARGYRPGRFSFNVPGGRCETCRGDGQIKVEMHFLPDLYIPCDACRGARYNQAALEVRFRGHTIADVLAMTVDDAALLFANQPAVSRRLHTLQAVGLGYIRLGQPATQLSGGEAQRVKLSTQLSRRSTTHTLYLLDEPTTGLHLVDIEKLLHVLHRLVDAGNTVIVIEHNLDVIKTADHIIDIGPNGGPTGGRVVVAGTPEKVAQTKASETGHFLRPLLSPAL